jgi:catechol 1,2-dioxygenase
LRSNLIPTGSAGEVMNLYGTVYQKDGKTPMPNSLIEAWQCDEKEVYDNTSDEFRFRGAVKSAKDGTYRFKTIIPVPYKDGEIWRPAHIHLRVSSADHQDLITQIYFKGDPHIDKDPAAASPLAVNRILEIKKQSNKESEVRFDVVMGKAMILADSAYKKITGLYKLKNGFTEFNREDDLLMMKHNGQLVEALLYKGNNTFEGGLGYVKVKFELLADGNVKSVIQMGDWESGDFTKSVMTEEGLKFLKYGN